MEPAENNDIVTMVDVLNEEKGKNQKINHGFIKKFEGKIF